MSVIVKLSIRSSEFVLGTVLARDPNTHVEMERVVPTSGQVMPYLWVRGDDPAEFERLVSESPHVSRLVAIDAQDGNGLYRVNWVGDVESLVNGISRTDATILEARGKERWRFRLRFPDHDSLAAFSQYCRERDIEFTLHSVHTTGKNPLEYPFELTEPQHQAVTEAVARGYFEVPRRATLSDIATELDISQQTASETVRRGTNKVLRGALPDRDRSTEVINDR